jgi:hypothetical protein
MVRRNGGIIGRRQDPSVTGAKGIWDTYDQYTYRKVGIFPQIGSIGNVTLNGSTSPQSVNEGSTLTYVVSTTNIFDEQTIDWEIVSVVGTVSSADFTGDLASMSGTITINSNSATLTGGLVASDGAEGEAFKIQFKPSNSGEAFTAFSPTATITDVVGEDIASAYYQICTNRIIDSTSSDYTGNWDVAEVQIANSGSYRLYMVGKVTASTTYTNDICVAAVHVYRDSFSTNSAYLAYNFTNNNSFNNRNWERYNGRISGTSSLGVPSTFALSNVNSLSWSGISSGGSTAYWGGTTGTGSWYTGMADGISQYNNFLTVGNGTVAQSSGEYYIYTEVSGAARYSSVACRSPSIPFAVGDRIRVCYAVVIPSNMQASQNLSDTLWIGLA